MRVIFLIAVLFSGCATPGKIVTSFDSQGGIKRIEVTPVADSIEPPKVSIFKLSEDFQIDISAGKAPNNVTKKGINLWYTIGAGTFVAGIAAAFMRNFRLAILLALGGVAMGVLASLLASPWMPALGLILVVGAGFLYWGYSIKKNDSLKPSIDAS